MHPFGDVASVDCGCAPARNGRDAALVSIIDARLNPLTALPLHLLLAATLLTLGWFQLHHKLWAHLHDDGAACEICVFAGLILPAIATRKQQADAILWQGYLLGALGHGGGRFES